ncbi:MAG: DUF1638 domain-containing protein [Phycisphaerae bacterium]|nr:DUF1638 domain-containing protein [Phycisphaerae bacterium]
MESIKRYKFIGCEVFYREACYLASMSKDLVDVEFLRKGLHDLETADMVARIQNAVDLASNADVPYDAILLGYGRCNDGLVDITAGEVPLVIPKAHDCITVFFGSRGDYKKHFDENSGTYYETTGWIERGDCDDGSVQRPAYGMEGVMGKLGLTESYEQLVAKHGKDNADYLVETLGGWEQAYSQLCYLEMGVCDESEFITTAKKRAEQHGWKFELRKGALTLLRKLFSGKWDDDFVLVPPNSKLVAKNDENILGVEPI